MQQSFDLTDTIETFIDARLEGVYTALPGVITAYDASIQSVDVQPAIWNAYENEAGDRVAERPPIVQRVPVMFPGSGGFRITFPVQVGDTCLLVFSSRSLDRWLSIGGDQDPGDDRRHAISDAVCVVGLRDFGHALSSAPTSTMSVGKDGGPTIEFTASEIQAGGTSQLATKADVQNLRDYVNMQFDVTAGHHHTVSGAATTSTITVPVTSGTPTVAPSNPNGTNILKGA